MHRNERGSTTAVPVTHRSVCETIEAGRFTAVVPSHGVAPADTEDQRKGEGQLMKDAIKTAVRDPESAEAAYRRRINAMLEQIDLVGLHLVFNLVLSLSQLIHRKEV